MFGIDKLKAVISSDTSNEYQLYEDNDVILGQSCGKKVGRAYYLGVVDTVVMLATGRLDNTHELCRLLGISSADQAELTDSELLRHAFLAWGNGCFSRILGDWILAVWQPLNRQLLLARSHHGNIPLYYVTSDNEFAFASSRHLLTALNLVPLELDELYLAQHLIAWPAYLGERTLHKPIKQLPPAHYLTKTHEAVISRRYWFPELNAELYLPTRQGYVEALRTVFDEAVRCRIRSTGPIAASLSGGLDSSSVAVTAARLLADRGQRLTAFTAVPRFDIRPYVKARFGDELPYTRSIAEYSGNIDLQPLMTSEISPIMAIRRVLQLQRDICHGASNLFWLLDIQQSAMNSGRTVLLNGAGGNGSISWAGNIFSQHWSFLFAHVSRQALVHAYTTRLKNSVRSYLPITCFAAIQKRRMDKRNWYRSSAIHPDFAHRLRLLEQRLHDPLDQAPRTAREQLAQILKPGRSLAGAFATEMGAAHGLEVRDPTTDARVIDFIFTVPDQMFIDPKSGIDRWLIREAMKGRLPDEVRLNRRRGMQSADLVPRLRACAVEVEAALDELDRGPAAEYVDTGYMRQVWKMVQTENTTEALVRSITVLTRGILAGLFVNQFYGYGE
jgi:asparagine synthase (glutamine-hydrolysing)